MSQDQDRTPGSEAADEASFEDIEAVKKLTSAYASMKTEVAKVIVGQEKVIDQVLIAIFSRGHCLLIGVPGLAKTMLIKTLAETMTLTFSRIQFTPDLMPSDITGTEVIQEDKASGSRTFKFLHGPIFANIILADEINRTPPKTQAALLEAMQEYQVTAGGQRHPLAPPFFVLATQNPIEQEGTYPLPEAQQDRFMFNILVDYPTEEEELEIMKLTTATYKAELGSILSGEDILKLQEIVRRVPIADHVIRYAMQLVRSTRVGSPGVPTFIDEWVTWGAGPRATQYLVLGAKARAILLGRFYATTDDIKAVAKPVLRHRIITNFSAEAEGVTTDDIVEKLMDTVPSDRPEALNDDRLPEVLGSPNAE